MKRYTTLFALLLIFMSTLSSCQAIGDLMKASFWAGAIVVIVIIAVIIWLVNKARK